MAYFLRYKAGNNKSIILEDSKTNEKPDVLPRSLTLSQGKCSTLDITPTEGWFFSSSNEKVAAVSITGTITGNSTGTAAITCSHKESGTLITVSVLVTGGQSGKK